MSDSDLIQLYSARILQLTTEIPHLGRLPAPEGSATRRSPQCGSTVTVDVTLQDGRVANFAQDVKACALGQAAAAILGQALPGLTRAEVARGAQALRAMLEGGPVPPAPFAGYEVLTAARSFANRHASILLAIEAAAEAITAAETRAKP